MASDDTIPTRLPRKRVTADWFNVIKRALSGDLLPRNASGVATDLAGSLGRSDLRWLKLRIVSGHWTVGDVKVIHPYNGDVVPGEGWMKMDGRTISQANYDTEHGSGHWATYIGTSSIDGKKLPDMTNKYAAGAASTSQDGSAPITSVGSGSHLMNLEHNHRWYDNQVATLSDKSYDSGGNAQNLVTTGFTAGAPTPSITSNPVDPTNLPLQDSDYYTQPGLSPSQSIQPDSMQAVFYMRII